VNAGALAVYADDFGQAVDNLLEVWRTSSRATSTARTSPASAPTAAAGSRASSSAPSSRTSASRSSTTARCRACSARYLDFERIERNIEAGALDAVAITCSGYTSGRAAASSRARGARELEALAAHRHQDAPHGRAPDGLERDPVPLSRRTI
jgi:hypothetical protein